MIEAKSLDTAKPKYIVIFKEPSEKNTRTMSTLLKRGAATGRKSHAARVSLLQAGESGVMTRIYEGIGAAAADLTEQQVQALRTREDVALVAVNQVRYLPPARRSRDAQGAGDGASGTSPITPAQAYLMGMRDAANAALGFLGQDGPASAGSRAGILALPAATQRMTWGLRAMGLAQTGVPTGLGVKVAVLDTGIDLRHRDIGGKVVEGQTAVSLVSGVSVQDVNGHGTHCAGTVAGPERSTSGTRYGVAPGASLLVGKVFNNRARPGATDDDIIEGIEWADEQGARIISMSLGSPREPGEAFASAYEALASQLRSRGQNSILVFAAAGNESERPLLTAAVGNPAACPSIVSVGAVDRDHRIADFSCGQQDEIGEVNICGPGVGVFSSYTGDTFESLDGTSMATPHLAGLAALLLEEDPSRSAQQVISQIVARALPLGGPRDFGAGLARL